MTIYQLKKKIAKAHKSATNWFNVTGAALLTVMLAEPTLINFLNDNELSWIIIVGNIALRFKTSKDLSDK